MNRRRLVIAGALIVIFVLWYEFRPEQLFVNRHVSQSLSDTNMASLETLTSGPFHSIAHETKGTATVYQHTNGSRILRFSEFSTSNGPDVHVYMVAADDAYDAATVERAGFVDLGSIKGNTGDQRYTLGRD